MQIVRVGIVYNGPFKHIVMMCDSFQMITQFQSIWHARIVLLHRAALLTVPQQGLSIRLDGVVWRGRGVQHVFPLTNEKKEHSGNATNIFRRFDYSRVIYVIFV